MASRQTAGTAAQEVGHPQQLTTSRRGKLARNKRLLAILAGVLLTVGGATAWLTMKALIIADELSATTQLVPVLKDSVLKGEMRSAAQVVERMESHTSSAKDAAGDPLWTLVSALPGIGGNFTAVTEVTRSAEDVAHLGLAPLIKAYGSFEWDALLPAGDGANLGELQRAAPTIASAAHAVQASAERLELIDASKLAPQVSSPLVNGRAQLREATASLNAAAAASKLAPAMLGVDGNRSYLLMIQNSAESRASGGIPGALAVLEVHEGKLTLGAQSSASQLGPFNPVVQVDANQKNIYTARLGKYMQDVNLTPNFPSSAEIAKSMWELRTGQRVDGVISVDPIVLGYVLKATGPVELRGSELLSSVPSGMPPQLTSANAVSTLLSDVYAKIEDPKLQDAYFASVAQEIFSKITGGETDTVALIDALSRGTQERRVLAWSAHTEEQNVLGTYPLGGAVTGPSVAPAEFGVYFNDGTGAKMDYYVKRTVQLVKACPKDGYEETTVRVTSTNTAPADATTSLPPYVTGDGVFGVPPGSVQTNIVAYGPAQAQVEAAKLDGQKTEFAPYFHGNRPVGVLAIRLAPGESKIVDFTFGKIVQHTEPNLVVTPTVQDVKDVTLPTESAACG